MDKILPKVNIVELQKNVIGSKILPINITYHLTTYKTIKPSLISRAIGLIKSIFSAKSFINIFKKFKQFSKKIRKIFKKALKFFAKILKPIIKFISRILKSGVNLIIRMFRKFLRLAKRIFKTIIRILKKLLRIVLKIFKYIVTKIFNIVLRVSKKILSVLSKVVRKITLFIYKTFKKARKLIWLMRKATKALGFRKTSKSLKIFKGKVYKSPPGMRAIFKKLPPLIKDSVGKIFKMKPSPKKGYITMIKDITKPILKSMGGIINWFKNLGKKVMKSARLKKQLWSILGKVIKKIAAKLGLTFAASAALASGIGFPIGVLIFIGKWLAGIAGDLLLFGGAAKTTWKELITAILENMPYLDIIFVLDHMLSDLMGASLGIFNTAFDWLKSIFFIKNEDLNKRVVGEEPTQKIKKVSDPNFFVLNNMNDIKNIKTNQPHIFNIIDEIYNEQNIGLINIISKNIKKFHEILKYRNEYILKNVG